MRNSNTVLVHINLPTHPGEVRVGYLRFKVKQNMPKNVCVWDAIDLDILRKTVRVKNGAPVAVGNTSGKAAIFLTRFNRDCSNKRHPNSSADKRVRIIKHNLKLSKQKQFLTF